MWNVLKLLHMIRIADRSKHGWATVEEYELADNSDDEKKLKQRHVLGENSGKSLPRARERRGINF